VLTVGKEVDKGIEMTKVGQQLFFWGSYVDVPKERKKQKKKKKKKRKEVIYVQK
jgi:hypothetical protein